MKNRYRLSKSKIYGRGAGCSNNNTISFPPEEMFYIALYDLSNERQVQILNHFHNNTNELYNNVIANIDRPFTVQKMRNYMNTLHLF